MKDKKSGDDSVKDRFRREMKDAMDEYDIEQELEDLRTTVIDRVVRNKSEKGLEDLFDSNSFNLDDELFDDLFGFEEDESTSHSTRYVEDGILFIVTDLPGFYENEVDLRVDDEGVRISAETDRQNRSDVSRVFGLDKDVNLEESEATLERGVLTVRLPLQGEDSDRTTITVS